MTNEGLRTERLILRQALAADASFILQLLTDPDWLKNIGDRGVHDLDGARAYIADNLQAMYRQRGFGLLVVTDVRSAQPMGLCGILKRPELDDADLGYAFLPEFRGRGYAREAAAGVLSWARRDHGLSRLVAITLNANVASVRLLTKLGFGFDRQIEQPGEAPLAIYINKDV